MDEKLIDILMDAKASLDEDEKELFTDMMKMALKYTTARFNWNLMTLEEKDADDKSRSMTHNRFMDTMKILMRYRKSLDKTYMDFSELDRKAYGDIANEIVCYFAKLQR